MRYLILLAVAAVNLIFTGAVFPNLNIAGIAPDILVCTLTSIAIMEKSMMSAIFGLVCGLVLDVMFSGTIGFYAIPLFLTGAVLYFTARRLKYFDKYLLPAVFAAGAYVFKEILSAIIAYMLGIGFSFWHMMARYILPEAIVTCVFMLIVHAIFTRLYLTSSLKPHYVDDIKKLL